MVIHIMVSSELEKLMVRVFINGIMERSMMVSGIMVSNMVMVFGKVSLVIPILVNGDILKQKDMVFIIGRQEIGMRENGSSV